MPSFKHAAYQWGWQRHNLYPRQIKCFYSS